MLPKGIHNWVAWLIRRVSGSMPESKGEGKNNGKKRNGGFLEMNRQNPRTTESQTGQGDTEWTNTDLGHN